MAFESKRVRIMLAALVLIAGSGCANTYRSLRSDRDVPELARLAAMSDAMRQETIVVPVQLAAGVTARVAIHISGPKDARRVLVLIHGVLSDADVWYYLRGELARQYRVITLDLPGAGQSDAPDPGSLGADGYGSSMLCDAALSALASRPEIQTADHMTLIGHSLGGLLIVRMLSDPEVLGRYADLLGRVDGAVLFTPIDAAVEKETPVFRAIADLPDWKVGLASVTTLLREQTAQATLAGVADPKMATREQVDRFVHILTDARIRHAQQSMLLHAVPWSGRRPDWEGIERWVKNYPNVRPTCLIVWGARDELFPVSMGYKLSTEIPHAQLRVVPAAMHSLPTERPLVCVNLIERFLDASRPAMAQRIEWLRLDQPVDN